MHAVCIYLLVHIYICYTSIYIYIYMCGAVFQTTIVPLVQGEMIRLGIERTLKLVHGLSVQVAGVAVYIQEAEW
jgi:hypothetical protein